MPRTRDEYEYFIDLSSETLSIFKIHFFWMKPYRWYTEEIIHDITEFLISIDDRTVDIDAEEFASVWELVNVPNVGWLVFRMKPNGCVYVEFLFNMTRLLSYVRLLYFNKIDFQFFISFLYTH